MKREIKFRALYDGVWYYQTLEEMLTITLAAFRNGEHKTQFTGLTDKNGKERYDDDIIKRHTGYIFKEEKKWFSLGDKNSAKCFGYDYHPDDEIIGNIYENPELLNPQS